VGEGVGEAESAGGESGGEGWWHVGRPMMYHIVVPR